MAKITVWFVLNSIYLVNTYQRLRMKMSFYLQVLKKMTWETSSAKSVHKFELEDSYIHKYWNET